MAIGNSCASGAAKECQEVVMLDRVQRDVSLHSNSVITFFIL